MADSIFLHGADDVRSAGNTIAHAADTMVRAASNIDGALERHQRFLDEWLVRFEQAVDKIAKPR